MKNFFIDITSLEKKGNIFKRTVIFYQVEDYEKVNTFITFSLADKSITALTMQIYNALSFISYSMDEKQIVVNEDLEYDLRYLRYIFVDDCFINYKNNSVRTKPYKISDLFKTGRNN